MKIIYDDLDEFVEVVVRCDTTIKKGKCKYCPFYDRCDVIGNPCIMQGKVKKRRKK